MGVGVRMVLAGGLVLDGTGAPPFVGDVAIEAGRIAAVGPASDSHGAASVVDVEGLVVAPGFIDAHSHADNAPFLGETDLSKLTQGITTEVVGNCGFSLAPRSRQHGAAVDSYLSLLFPPSALGHGERMPALFQAADARGYPTNVLPLVGHGTLRAAVMGFDDRPPSGRELAAMGDHLEEALDAGAGGLSSGLIYRPGTYARTDELAALAGRMQGRPAVYASHIRNEGSGLLAAIDEALAVGRGGGVPVHVSHLKSAGAQAWGLVADALARLAAARHDGQRVSQDVYPYTASSTMLVVCLPRALRNLSNPEILRRLRAPDSVEAVREGLRQEGDDQRRFASVYVSSTHDHRYEGRTLAELAQAMGTDGAEALVRVLVDEELRAIMVSFSMREEDIESVLRDPYTAIGTDGAPPGLGGRPHPRLWGTFPRILGRYVRERRVLDLADAVRRMTSLPADVFRLREVGRLAPGMRADVVVFDPATVADRATYDDPTQAAMGIEHVLVGGTWSVRAALPTGVRVGARLAPSP